jgi:sortase A
LEARRVRRLAVSALLLAGVALLGEGLWIPAKAELAQLLLERAWERSLRGEAEAAPWPWADTWPLARLRIGEQKSDLLVLSGASGRNLAFGPAHVAGTAPPGSTGNSVLAGHRDTHFASLEDLGAGDLLWLETPDGVVRRYQVQGAAVVHESDVSPLEPAAEPVLTLITCFPFDATLPGGPLRYVVQAVAR